MAVNNQKYTSYYDIWARLSRVHTTKKFSPSEIIEWCSEVEVDILGDLEAMRYYKEVEVVVENLQALIPCNAYRIMDVYINQDRRIDYVNQGDYLTFKSGQQFMKNDQNQDIVKLNYHGIAIDPKNGYPLIKKGHELACEAYCTWKVYYEDFLTGKLGPTQWGFINQQKESELSAANNGFRHWNNADLERIHMIMYNMIPRIGQIPLGHLQWEQHPGNQIGF